MLINLTNYDVETKKDHAQLLVSLFTVAAVRELRRGRRQLFVLAEHLMFLPERFPTCIASSRCKRDYLLYKVIEVEVLWYLPGTLCTVYVTLLYNICDSISRNIILEAVVVQSMHLGRSTRVYQE